MVVIAVHYLLEMETPLRIMKLKMDFVYSSFNFSVWK